MGIDKISGVSFSGIDDFSGVATSGIEKISGINAGGMYTTNLTNRWSPANYSGSGSFLDEVGNEDIVITGATYSSTQPAHFDFDGVNDAGGSSSFSWSPTDISLGWWMNADAAGATQVMCGFYGSIGIQGLFHYLRVDGGMNWIWTNSSNQSRQATWTTSFPLNEWVYITISRTNSTGAINAYLGRASTGLVQVVTNGSGSSTGSITGQYIYGSPGYDFNGSLAEYHVYDQVLTTSQWTQNFNAQKGYYGL